jgi:hypothetical protein
VDDQRLKEMLSAWFDGELSFEEAAQVEAYIAHSAEARQIVARYEALKKLTDSSVLNLKSDYWERSAGKIEAALGEQALTKIRPAKKSSWSSSGVKTVSLAASMMLLVYVGFHSEEILDRLHEQEPIPPAENVIQKKAAEDKSIQTLKPGVDPHKKEVNEKLNLPPRVKPKPEPEPKPKPTAEEMRPVEPVLEYESDEAIKLREARSKETSTVDIEQNREVISDRSATSPVQVDKDNLRSAPATSPASTKPSSRVVGEVSQKSRTDETTALANEMAESGPAVTADSLPQPSEGEQYRYLWDHVIVQQLADMDKETAKPSILEGLKSTLNTGLSAKGTDKKVKQGKDQVTRDLERERRLINAAFHVGQTTKDEAERKQALRYLVQMSAKSGSKENQDYASQKLSELKQAR